MSRCAQHGRAVGFVEARHALAALHHDWRGADLLQRDAALLGDVHQPVDKHLIADGIDLHETSPLLLSLRRDDLAGFVDDALGQHVKLVHQRLDILAADEVDL